MRNNHERLQDILDAIAQIEKYATQGKDSFEQNELVQVWIVHHLQIIGEAARSLSNTVQQQHTNIPWAEIIAFRNILVHEYFRINLNTVWRVVERDIPNLKTRIQDILTQQD